MRANSPPAAKLKGDFATATSCPFVEVIVKHQMESWFRWWSRKQTCRSDRR